MEKRKRINLSFSLEEFNLIKNKSIKENIKPSTLVKNLILDLIQKENKDSLKNKIEIFIEEENKKYGTQ